MKYRLRSTTVQAVRWHGDHGKLHAFAEIEAAFDIHPHSGRIGRMLNGVIGVADEPSPGGYEHSVTVAPGQWIVRGILDGMIAMNDDLFQAFFKLVE